jgi:hypothetical protein
MILAREDRPSDPDRPWLLLENALRRGSESRSNQNPGVRGVDDGVGRCALGDLQQREDDHARGPRGASIAPTVRRLTKSSAVTMT